MSNNAKNLPEVKLGQYKGLAVTRHVRPLSEKTIDQEMVHQTRMRSVYHNSTAPAKRGSRVLLDFVGFMDGEEIPDSRMEKVMVVLGDGKLMPAAEDAIYGHTAGETFRFDFTYPEQFRVEDLSGKTAQFEIKLHSVAEKTTPELNEEFARAQGYADLAAMREAGVKLTIVSNGAEKRVRPFAEKLGLAYLYRAAKPLPFALMVAQHRMGVKHRQMAMVGDQLYADRMVAALYGIPGLMVIPRGPDLGAQVILKRKWEKKHWQKYYDRGGKTL